jgi:hypothetical protein
MKRRRRDEKGKQWKKQRMDNKWSKERRKAEHKSK